MELFRISRSKFAKRLTVSGSENRWNKAGQKVIYASSSRALATLERVVHEGAVQPGVGYKVMIISVTDEDRLVKQIYISDLPKNWRRMAAYPRLQEIGSGWYLERAFLLLKVPSVVIPPEYNYVINTEHPDFERQVRLVRTEDYFWDERLLQDPGQKTR